MQNRSSCLDAINVSYCHTVRWKSDLLESQKKIVLHKWQRRLKILESVFKKLEYVSIKVNGL